MSETAVPCLDIDLLPAADGSGASEAGSVRLGSISSGFIRIQIDRDMRLQG